MGAGSVSAGAAGKSRIYYWISPPVSTFFTFLGENEAISPKPHFVI